MIDWHRLFGLTLTDYFTGSAYRIEMETDLSIKQQLLDILIIEQEEGSPVTQPPAGLDNLSRHNLMTYKSLHQPLDAWALDELVGHYVNYRKQRSPSFEALLPAEDFSLYAVTATHIRRDTLNGRAGLRPRQAHGSPSLASCERGGDATPPYRSRSPGFSMLFFKCARGGGHREILILISTGR